MSYPPPQFDTGLAIDRIINWLKADKNLFDITKPEGDPIVAQDTSPSITTKCNSIIYGVPEEEHWQSLPPPFISVSHSDQLMTSEQYFGSVINNVLTSAYDKYQFDIIFVVQSAKSEDTERLVAFMRNEIHKQLKSNVDLSDTDSNGSQIPNTGICATSRVIKIDIFPAAMFNRRLIGYRILFEIEVQT